MTELLPCPFCGHTPTLVKSEDCEGMFHVVCQMWNGGCGARTVMGNSRERIIFYWNRREGSK